MWPVQVLLAVVLCRPPCYSRSDGAAAAHYLQAEWERLIAEEECSDWPLAVFLSRPWSSLWLPVCVCVCWYCHRSGGTDVVDLPDFLLPEGQYLDMFDSESDLSGDLSG